MSDEARQELLRKLPAVSTLLDSDDGRMMVASHGHDQTTDALRAADDGLRADILAGEEADVEPAAVLASAQAALAQDEAPRLHPVINATGIILHTGLGRAVLPRAAVDALSRLTGCCNVQMDLETGERVKREACVRDLVRRLTGAEDMLVVNNNAGATMLVLRALAAEREVVVSRGELIEIGGSFRLPDIMSESGATMREVGSTNKTHPRDYENAITPMNTALLLKAHKSNYAIVGFTKEVSIGELAEIGNAHGIPVVDDLGCGALVPLETYDLPHEGTVRESLDAGADVVLFSTDKLIGGPQGGMIVGRKDLIARIRSHPMYRALRVGKMTLTALEATLRLFLAPERLAQTHPTYAMLSKSLPDMERQAGGIAERIRALPVDWRADVTRERSYLGGGSLPASHLDAAAVQLSHPTLGAGALAAALRSGTPSVVAHVADERVLLNMRTISDEEGDLVVEAVSQIS